MTDNNLAVVRNWLKAQADKAYAGNLADRAIPALRAALNLAEASALRISAANEYRDDFDDEALEQWMDRTDEARQREDDALARYQEAKKCLTV